MWLTTDELGREGCKCYPSGSSGDWVAGPPSWTAGAQQLTAVHGAPRNLSTV